MSESILKPCPFCGKEAEFENLEGSIYWRVQCESSFHCGTGPWRVSKPKARIAWNRRFSLGTSEGERFKDREEACPSCGFPSEEAAKSLDSWDTRRAKDVVVEAALANFIHNDFVGSDTCFADLSDALAFYETLLKDSKYKKSES